MKPKNIFIDCTATYYTGLNTGIQRVVKNIIARTDYIEKEFGIKCTPVVLKKNEFVAIAKEDLLSRKPNQNVLKAKALLSKILPLKIYFFAKSLYGRLFLLFAKPTIKAPSITINESDILLGVDVFWELGFFEAIKAYKEKYKIYFFLLIYDIIPLLFPQYYRDQIPKKFKKYFSQTSVYDAILTTSYANVNQIKQLDENIYKGIKTKPIGVFTLGSDIRPLNVSKTNEHLEHITKDSEVYLMVGTIEPRKNHDLVLNAFEKIWERDLSKKLVIVGRIGWLCQHTLKRIKSSKYYNKNLFMFNQLNDQDLTFLYKNAKAVIVASAIEGFGLPLVEAMYYNIPVIASDIEVFREVGKQYPIYFSLSNIDSLINAINSVNSKKFDSVSFKPYTWDESVKELISTTLRIYENLINNTKAEER